MSGLLGEFYAFVDGGSSRNAIKMQKLEGSEPQGDENFWIDPGIGAFQESLKLLVELNLPAEYAQDQGCGQVPVRRGESGDGFAAQQIVGVRMAALNSHEDVKGGVARGGDGGHDFSLSANRSGHRR